MGATGRAGTKRDLEPILAVAAKLAAPFDLTTMLTEVVEAAKQILEVDRAAVWLHEPATDELVLTFSIDNVQARVPAGTGLVGTCARNRKLINVPDCYADSRFDPSTDRRTGFRSRCMLTLPMVDHKGVLVGVMQVLNKREGVFDAEDEALATVLAAQCAVALQRVRMTEALIEGEKLRQELELARVLQMSSLPSQMPAFPGYDLYGTFRPADLTGGDTFDLAVFGHELLVVLGDATGHGIGPALSVTQMQAMLRMAFRLGADLDTAFVNVNNQLGESLPDDRFITAFVGLVDRRAHQIRFHSGGQAPILFYEAALGKCVSHGPTSFPLAAMPIDKLRRAAMTMAMMPGDILALVSDGIFECHDDWGAEFGEERVRAILQEHHAKPVAELAAILFKEVGRFAAGGAPEDDMTVVFVKRDPSVSAAGEFPRTFEAIDGLVAFTARAFADAGIEAELRPAVDLVLEELFTNVVKYGHPSDQPVHVDLTRVVGGVEITLTVEDADDFDVTQAGSVDVNAPIERRTPGGLGLHLVRKLVDSIHYRYLKETRQGRITFRKTVAHEGARGE